MRATGLSRNDAALLLRHHDGGRAVLEPRCRLPVMAGGARGVPNFTMLTLFQSRARR